MTDAASPARGRLWLRVLVAVAAAFALLGHVSVARAGVALSPNGQTTSQPTFVVYLEPSEQLDAEVFVTTDGLYDSSYYPLHEVGSCFPFTPTGAQNEYSCQPLSYSTADSSFSSALPPGTYLWWLRFYHSDPGSFLPTLHISGPIQITVPQPVAPAGAGPVSPFDGDVVSAAPTLTIHAPANSQFDLYVSTSSQHLDDGTPALDSAYHCSGTATTDSNYSCTVDLYLLDPGQTYYWWMTLDVGGVGWIYTARLFTTAAPASGGGGSGGGGSGSGGNNGPHVITDANQLQRSAHFTGRSIDQTRLASASYWITKAAGRPKMLGVACWNSTDWPGISGDSGDSYYSTLGFYDPAMPHWIHLSPTVCRGIETLLYHRPIYPNRIIANAVDTVTHEMIHALGITNEAQTECYAMQVSIVMALRLGVPLQYSQQLAHLTLANYFLHPPEYVDTVRCREGGVWDLQPNQPSPPWHNLSLLR